MNSNGAQESSADTRDNTLLISHDAENASPLATQSPRLDESAIHNARFALSHGKSWSQALAASAPHALSVEGVLGAGKQLHQALSSVGSTFHSILEDPDVTDILVNGIQSIWVDRGNGLERIPQNQFSFSSDEEVRTLAVRIAALCGQRLDDQSPIVDGTLEGGLRLHAVLPPLGAEGTLISVRRHRPIIFSLDELALRGMYPPAIIPLLHAFISHKANAIISGSTGSGKTTLLSSLLSTIPHSERILIIEESVELRPRHPHVIHLQVRKANIQGAGEITMSSLVKAAMRMRPDRIILGECRGEEVRDVLSALNTGHEGGWATIHANSATDVPSRLVALGALAGMSESVIAAQASSGLDAVFHIERGSSGRRLRSIAVFEKFKGELIARPALIFEAESWKVLPGWEKLRQRLKLPDSFLDSLHNSHNSAGAPHGSHERADKLLSRRGAHRKETNA